MEGATREELLSEAVEGRLLQAIFERYSVQEARGSNTARQLAELHNSGEIDVLSIVTAEALSQFPKHLFFNGHVFYGELIPNLEASAVRIARVIDDLAQAAGTDGLKYYPLEGLANWCAGKPERAEELLLLADQGGQNSSHYLNIAIRCGFSANKDRFLSRAYDALESGSDADVRSALAALDRLPLQSRDDGERFLKEMLAFIAREPSDEARSSALASTVAQLKNATSPEYRESLVALSLQIIGEAKSHVQYEVARLLLTEGDWLPDSIRAAAFDAFALVPSANKGTFDQIDMVLQKILERGNPLAVRFFVERAIRREPDPVPVSFFDSVFYELRANGGQVFEDWIVAWLLDGDYELCSAIVEGFFAKGATQCAFEIDLSRFGLRPEDYPYLARKAIGTFFIQPLLMCSFVVCLIRSAPASVAEELGTYLFDPILLNYSGAASEYLAPLVSSPEPTLSRLVKNALDERNNYLNRLRAVGSIPELGPTEQERQLEWQRQTDRMAEAYREGRQNSLASMLFSEKLILHGSGTIYRMYGGSSPTRMENEFRKIEHSIEMPRLDVWDPIGLDAMIRRFRLEARPV